MGDDEDLLDELSNIPDDQVNHSADATFNTLLELYLKDRSYEEVEAALENAPTYLIGELATGAGALKQLGRLFAKHDRGKFLNFRIIGPQIQAICVGITERKGHVLAELRQQAEEALRRADEEKAAQQAFYKDNALYGLF